MVTDCGHCAKRGCPDCRAVPDCVVAVLEPGRGNGRPRPGPAASRELGQTELRALRVLAAAGLVPPLRLPRARSEVQNGFPAAKAS
jgi:hypothetical protein